METSNLLGQGMIFFMPDRAKLYNGKERGKHRYLIIGGTNTVRTGDCGYVQCMCITSMYNKDVRYEIPIVTEDGTIGYIVPYNIFSYDTSEFYRSNARGVLQPTELYTVEGFISFLQDVYDDCHGRGHLTHKEVVEKIDEYNTYFWDMFGNHQEYRNTEDKINRASNNEYTDSEQFRSSPFRFPNPESKSIMVHPDKRTSSPYSENETKKKHHIYKTTSRNDIYNDYHGKEPEKNEEQMVAANCSEEETPTVYSSEGCINGINIPQSLISKLPANPDEKDFSDMTAMEFFGYCKSNPIKETKDFVETFLKLYHESSVEDISKWMGMSKSAIYRRKNMLCELAKSNGWNNFNLIGRRGRYKRKSTINSVSMDPRKWSDDELMKYINLATNNSSEFMLNYLGYTCMQSVYQKNYIAKKEAKARGLLVASN